MPSSVRSVADLADEMIPAPRRAIPGRGVLAGVGTVTIRTRGFSADFASALSTWRAGRASADDAAQHDLMIERVTAPFPGIPAEAETEAYRCGIGSRVSVIQASTEQGARNGLATFREAVALLGRGAWVRETLIEDWPAATVRGVSMADAPDTSLMCLEDWKRVVDELADLKLNALAVTPVLAAAPAPEPVRWYSPGKDRWRELRGGSAALSGDSLRELEIHGRSRGVRILAPGAPPLPSCPAHDPARYLDLALIADAAWGSDSGAGTRRRRATRRLAGEAEPLEEALRELDRAAASPAVAGCTCRSRTHAPRYPVDALEAIEAAGPRARTELEEMGRHAARALEILEGLEREASREPDRGPLCNLRAEAAGLDALAGVFSAMLGARAALGSGLPAEAVGLPAAMRARREALLSSMESIERRRPTYLIPIALRDLSVLYQVLTNLEADCAEVAGRRRAPATVRWCLAP